MEVLGATGQKAMKQHSQRGKRVRASEGKVEHRENTRAKRCLGTRTKQAKSPPHNPTLPQANN